MNRKQAPILMVILVVVIMVVVGAIVFQRPTIDIDASDVRIAAVLNLTGPSAQFDAVKQQALRIAIERVRELYPQRTFTLEVFDAGGGPEATHIAVAKAREWGACYFLSGTSPTALAIASQVRNATPPVVQMANAANPEFGPPKPGEYRLWPDWQQEAKLVSELLIAQGMHHVLVIHSADPYSESLKQSLERELDKGAGIVAVYQQFDPASPPDFRPALTRAKRDNSDAIVVFGLPPGIRSLISQMKQVQWTGAVVGGVNINLTEGDFQQSGLSGPLWSLRTPTMERQLPEGSEALAFRTAYVKGYGEEPPFHSVYLADAIYLVAAADEKPDDSDPRLAVSQVRHFNSASGAIDVTEDGVLLYQMTPKRLLPREQP